MSDKKKSDRGKMQIGRTEVDIEDGKYTVVIDYRPGMEGLAIFRGGWPWCHDEDVRPGKPIIALACELERCRDVLYAILFACEQRSSELDRNIAEKIKEVLPIGYKPVVYEDRHE